jgi:hypothetical protein
MAETRAVSRFDLDEDQAIFILGDEIDFAYLRPPVSVNNFIAAVLQEGGSSIFTVSAEILFEIHTYESLGLLSVVSERTL